jgi:hypothetical protein
MRIKCDRTVPHEYLCLFFYFEPTGEESVAPAVKSDRQAAHEFAYGCAVYKTHCIKFISSKQTLVSQRLWNHRYMYFRMSQLSLSDTTQ